MEGDRECWWGANSHRLDEKYGTLMKRSERQRVSGDAHTYHIGKTGN